VPGPECGGQKRLERPAAGLWGEERVRHGGLRGGTAAPPSQGGSALGRRWAHPAGPPARLRRGRRPRRRHRRGSRPGSRRSRSGRGGVDQGLQQRSDVPATFAPPEHHHRFAGMVVNSPQATPHGWLCRGGDQDLPSLRAPHRPQAGPPAHVKVLGVGDDVGRLPVVAALFPRLVFTCYSGSGPLRGWWGRLRTMPPRFQARLTVSAEPRRPVLSAREATRRGSVPSANGSPQRRGRRRPALHNAARYASVTRAGCPGRGASGNPSRPAARERLSQRSTVASLARTVVAMWDTLSPCSAASTTICARVRTRGGGVVRDR
jgi:hypothetical protein